MSRFGQTYFQDRTTKLSFKSSLDMSTSSDSFSSFNRSINTSSSSDSSTSTSPNRDKKLVKEVANDISLFLPKNSIEVLNELKPGLVFITRPDLNNKIIAYVEVNGITYTGIGKTESIARQAAAENALKDLFVDIIISTMTNDYDNDILCNTAEWKLLGSFAMFKLIEEWLLYYMLQTPDKNEQKSTETLLKNGKNNSHQSKVTSTPKTKDEKKSIASHIKHEKNNSQESKSACIPNTTYESKQRPCKVTATDKKILPENTNTVVLLNTLLGSNLKFNDLQINKNRPPFSFSLLVDEIEYVGEPASSKKIAKQNAARKVLIKKYGYEFTK